MRTSLLAAPLFALAAMTAQALPTNPNAVVGVTPGHKWLQLKDFLVAANLDQVTFVPKCDLREADFSGKTLARADLRGTDCRGANFSGVDLRRTLLVGAALRFATFTGAVIQHSDAGLLALTGADLSGAIIVDGRVEDTKAAGAGAGSAAVESKAAPATAPSLAPAGPGAPADGIAEAMADLDLEDMDVACRGAGPHVSL